MADLDPHLQAPARLKLMSLLVTVSELEFATLREQLEVSDSVLSKHVAALAQVGYLRSRKGSHQGRRTTWISITGIGRKALSTHVAVLRAIVANVE
ncbi:transcriptional regulator [Kribbella sp. NPDC005582]|uniref:transcriptional regulator n=1 Tax=Kribbella sp. NPDC005582 TaxID=3156893 RepID=UPI0033B664F6